jgi:Mg2+ and Co2+ transporter CorA
MSNVISFLESVGQDAALRHATKEELELAMNRAKIDPATQSAILNKDQRVLAERLGGNTIVCSMVLPGKEEDDETEEEPSKDDDEIRGQSTTSRAA